MTFIEGKRYYNYCTNFGSYDYVHVYALHSANIVHTSQCSNARNEVGN